MNIPPFLIVMLGVSTAGVVTAWGLTSILKKQSAAVRHAIWLLAATSPIVTAAFLSLGLQFSVPVLPPKQPHPILLSASDFTNINVSSFNPAQSSADRPLPTQVSAPKSLTQNKYRTTSAPNAGPAWKVNKYLVTWFVGFFCVIIKTIIDHRQVILFLRKLSLPVPDKVAESAEMIRVEMKMKKRPCLKIAPPSQVPFCYGVLNPVVVLPATDDLELQASYLKHEFAHVMRWDLLWMFLGRVACGLCWFNPLSWIALDRVRRESEYVADDLVLAYGTEPASYASNILDLVQNCKMERRPLTLAMAQTTGLSRRIECIMDASLRRQLPSTTFLLTLALTTILLIFSVICLRLVAAESSDLLTAAPIKPPFPSGFVAIHVVDQNKKPLAGVLIIPDNIYSAKGSTYWVNPEDGSNKPTRDILTDANGQANIPYVLDDANRRPASDLNSIPISKITVQLSSPDFARTRASLSVSETNPDIVLQPGIVVTLKAIGGDGASLPNVSVLVDGNDQRLWGDKWHSSPDTKLVTSDPLLPGSYAFRIFTRENDGSLLFSDLVSVTLGMGQINAGYQFPVKPARTVVGVLDASVPRPVLHGFVTAFVSPRPLKEDGQPYEEPNWTTHAEIADNGTFVLKNLPDGVINITSFCDGHISKPSDDFAYAGICPQVFRDSKEQPIQVTMNPTGSLRVHLVSSGGASVQGMEVKATVTEWLDYGTSSQLGTIWDSLDQCLSKQGISTPDSSEYDYSGCYTQTADANGDAIIRSLPLGDKQSFYVHNAKGAFLGGGTAPVTNPESTVIFDVDTKKVLATLADAPVSFAFPPSSGPPQTSGLLAKITADAPLLETADELWAKINEHEKLETDLITTNRNNINADKIESELQEHISLLQKVIENYPQDSRYWRAKLELLQHKIQSKDKLTAGLQEIVEGKDVPTEIGAKAAVWFTSYKTSDLARTVAPTEETWDSYERLITDYCARYPKQTDSEKSMVLQMWEDELEILLETGNSSRYDTVMKRLNANPDPEIQKFAKGLDDRKNNKPLDLKSTSIGGEEVDLSKLWGHPVLLVFGATWCRPCVEEIPEELDLYNEFHSKGLEIIGVALDGNQEDVAKFVNDHKIPWPQVLDANRELSSSLGVFKYPQLWLLNKQGVVLERDGNPQMMAEKIKELCNDTANSSPQKSDAVGSTSITVQDKPVSITTYPKEPTSITPGSPRTTPEATATPLSTSSTDSTTPDMASDNNLVKVVTTQNMTAAEAKQSNIAALVNGEAIYWPDVDAASTDAYANIKKESTGSEQETRLSQARKGVLSDLINQRLIIASFRNSERFPETFVDERINKEIATSFNGDANLFNQGLKNHSLSLAKYRSDIENTAIINYMQVKNIDQKMKQYYQAHLELFPQCDKVNISVIGFLRVGDTDIETKTLEVKALGNTQMALTQMKDGVSFTDLVEKYSDWKVPCWVSLTPEYPQVDPYPYSDLSELWPIIQKLQPGQISGIITLRGSYSIVRLNDRRMATVKATPELDDSEVKKVEAMKSELENEWLNKLQKQASIQRFD